MNNPKFRAVVKGKNSTYLVLTMEWSLLGQVMSVTVLWDDDTQRQFLIEECEAILTFTGYRDGKRTNDSPEGEELYEQDRISTENPAIGDIEEAILNRDDKEGVFNLTFPDGDIHHLSDFDMRYINRIGSKWEKVSDVQ